MAKKSTSTGPSPAAQREAVINGQARASSVVTADFICLTERHGVRWLRLSAISQVIHDAGSVSGPWLLRIDGQQISVSAEVFQSVCERLHLSPS